MISWLAPTGLVVITVVALAAFSFRRPAAGFIAALSVVLAQIIAIQLPVVQIGALSVHLQDILMVALAIAGVLRSFEGGLFRRPFFLLVFAFGLVILIGFLRGASAASLEAAGNNLRTMFYFWAGLVFASTIDAEPRIGRAIWTVWMAATGVILIVASLRWLSVVLGLSSPGVWTVVGVWWPRVLDGRSALLLAQGFFISLATLAWRPPSRWRYAAPPILIAVVTLQQRTVWVVLAVALALWFLVARPLRRRLATTFLAAAVLGIMLAIALQAVVNPTRAAVGGTTRAATEVPVSSTQGPSPSTPETRAGKATEAVPETPTPPLVPQPVGPSPTCTDLVGTQLARALHLLPEVIRPNTFCWRILVWQASLKGYLDTPAAVLLGQPMGVEKTILVRGRVLGVGSHNFYIEVLIHVGVLGLLVFLALYALVGRNTAQQMSRLTGGAKPSLDIVLLASLLTTQAVYYLTYSPRLEQGLLLGLVAALSLPSNQP